MCTEKAAWLPQGYMEETDVLLYSERLLTVPERLLDRSADSSSPIPLSSPQPRIFFAVFAIRTPCTEQTLQPVCLWMYLPCSVSYWRIIYILIAAFLGNWKWLRALGLWAAEARIFCGQEMEQFLWLRARMRASQSSWIHDTVSFWSAARNPEKSA